MGFQHISIGFQNASFTVVCFWHDGWFWLWSGIRMVRFPFTVDKFDFGLVSFCFWLVLVLFWMSRFQLVCFSFRQEWFSLVTLQYCRFRFAFGQFFLKFCFVLGMSSWFCFGDVCLVWLGFGNVGLVRDRFCLILRAERREECPFLRGWSNFSCASSQNWPFHTAHARICPNL